MNVVEIVKEHPVPVGIGVVLILLVLLSRGGSQTSSASNSTAIAAASQASAQQANVQLAGMSANTSVALGAQNVTNKQTAENAATSRMGIAANLLSAITGFGASADANASNNALKIVQTTMSADVQKTQLANDLAIKSQTINAGIQTNSDTLEAQLTALVENNNAKLAQIGAATQGSVAVIQAGGAVQSGLLGQNLAFQDKNLSTILQHSETLASINGQTAIQSIQAQQRANDLKAEAAARAQNAATSQSWLSTAVNLFSSIF